GGGHRVCRVAGGGCLYAVEGVLHILRHSVEVGDVEARLHAPQLPVGAPPQLKVDDLVRLEELHRLQALAEGRGVDAAGPIALAARGVEKQVFVDLVVKTDDPGVRRGIGLEVGDGARYQARIVGAVAAADTVGRGVLAGTGAGGIVIPGVAIADVELEALEDVR